MGSSGPRRRREAGPRIRTATAADRRRWVDLRHALWPEAKRADLDREARRWLRPGGRAPGRRPPEAAVFVAETAEGSLVGFAEVGLRPYVDGCRTSPVGYLEGWYVAPAFRRRGTGRALVRAAESWARSIGCAEFASDTGVANPVSQRAHRALGFEETERLVLFRRTLAPRPRARRRRAGARVRRA